MTPAAAAGAHSGASITTQSQVAVVVKRTDRRHRNHCTASPPVVNQTRVRVDVEARALGFVVFLVEIAGERFTVADPVHQRYSVRKDFNAILIPIRLNPHQERGGTGSLEDHRV